MDGFELNKIAGAVLGSLLIVLGLGKLAGAIYGPPLEGEETVAVADIDATEPAADHGPADASVTPEASQSEGAPALVALFASVTEADAEKAARNCKACHSFDEGGRDAPGPNLWGIIGGPFGHRPGYNYSDAIETANAKGRVWSYENLDAYLADPAAFLPGNKMTFRGLKKPEQRAAMIVYLRAHMDNPPPLPELPADQAAASE